MRFIDEVKIIVISGRGGDGCVSFRREKYVPRGGPDGGNGGDGGSIIFEADEGVNTLLNFRGKKIYNAEDGGKGSGQQCFGKYGEDTVLKVPIGTIIRNAETNEVVADLTEHGQKIVLVKGGRGGLGNVNFKSATNQVPMKATVGQEGEEVELDLELKLIADIALIGLPNAGKSTLISAISNARPKIADYPFTTLEPNLGVVSIGDGGSIVVADIPGLIEDAAIGKGLGIKFLKHIERTKAFVHLVDISWCLEEFEAYESYVTVRHEIEKFKEQMALKNEIVCLTKIDAMTDEEVLKYQQFFEDHLGKRVLAISAVSGKNVDKLKTLMQRAIETSKKA